MASKPDTSTSKTSRVEKQQGAQRLVVRRSGDLPLHSEMGEKGFDLRFAQVDWMSLVVKQDEAANPLHVSFLSAVGVVLEPNDVPHLIQGFLRALLHK